MCPFIISVLDEKHQQRRVQIPTSTTSAPFSAISLPSKPTQLTRSENFQIQSSPQVLNLTTEPKEVK